MKIKDIRALIRDNPATQFARRPSKSSTSVQGFYVLDAEREWWPIGRFGGKYRLATRRTKMTEVLCAVPHDNRRDTFARKHRGFDFPSENVTWRPELIALGQIVLWEEARDEVADRLETRANNRSELDSSKALATRQVERLQRLGIVGPGDPERHMIFRGERVETSWHGHDRKPSGVEISLQAAERIADLLEAARKDCT